MNLIKNLVIREAFSNTDVNEFLLLREQNILKDKKMIGFRDVAEYSNELSSNNKMFVIEYEDGIIGGAFMAISNGDDSNLLPLQLSAAIENDKIFIPISKILDCYNFNRQKYGEIYRIFILPKFRSYEIFYKLIGTVIKASLSQEISFLLGLTDIIRAKLYKNIFARYGYHVFVHEDLKLIQKNEYEGKKMYVISTDIQNFTIIKNKTIFTMHKKKEEVYV